MQVGSLFLVLFAVTLFVTYLAVRRAWTSTVYAGALSAILSMTFVILYAVTAQDTSTAQAVFAGILVGLGFSAATVAIASFFRTNERPAQARLGATHEETQSDDQR